MNRTIRTLFVVLAVVVTMTAVAAADCTETVTGTVTALDAEYNSIIVDGVMVKQIALDYLNNQYGVQLVEGSQVVIVGELCNLTNVVRACTIQVDGGVVIELPGN